MKQYKEVKYSSQGAPGISLSFLYHLIFRKVPTYPPLITQNTLNVNDTLNQTNLRKDLAFSLSLKLRMGDID